MAALWAASVLGGDDVDSPDDLRVLGGKHAEALTRRRLLADPRNEHWPRVWAARALLYVWDEGAVPSVVDALADPAWRVREMAAKVVRRHEVGQAADQLAVMVGDETERVRVAALRGLAVVGESEHAAVVHDAEDDPDTAVRRAARAAVRDLARRLDRDV